ncbi:MAG: PulJ/GspJ family protein [Planctomycetota bacterium]
MNGPNRPTRRTAFTLIEILVAVVMLGAIMAAAAGLVGGVLVGTRRVEETIDADLALAEADEIIADDLAFIVAVPGTAPFTSRGRADGSSVVSFYTVAGAKAAWGEVATPVHVVTYSVETLRGGGKGLFRAEEPLVVSKDVFYDEPLLLIAPVENLFVEAFDGDEWHDEWPEVGAAGLPTLVRVTVTFPGEEEEWGRSIYVESAPAVEFIVKPQAERRASGRKESTERPAKDNESGDEGETERER